MSSEIFILAAEGTEHWLISQLMSWKMVGGERGMGEKGRKAKDKMQTAK